VAFETSSVAFETSSVAFETSSVAFETSSVAFETSSVAFETSNGPWKMAAFVKNSRFASDYAAFGIIEPFSNDQKPARSASSRSFLPAFQARFEQCSADNLARGRAHLRTGLSASPMDCDRACCRFVVGEPWRVRRAPAPAPFSASLEAESGSGLPQSKRSASPHERGAERLGACGERLLSSIPRALFPAEGAVKSSSLPA
jgi:hypothetical protein